MGTLIDAILVLNAGSSSIKLAVFAAQGGELLLQARGQVEGLYTEPRFEAHDATGRVVGDRSWSRTALGHDGAVESCARLRRGGASRRRWDSPPSMGCPWAPAAVRSIRACCGT
jgi:acetate kinase